MTETITLPLTRLLACETNVRKTDSAIAIDELAASISSHGLLQSLVVRKERRGKYAVVAGRRRLLALQKLVTTGTIAANLPVPCSVIADDVDATEISLVENVHREPMHPADEFDAFKALIEHGTAIADVAARFGVCESVVNKRLKLASVSPVLIAAYRQGDMDLQHVMAFSVSDDHAAQERVWEELPPWQRNNPNAIREKLTHAHVPATDGRVRFVTLKAYEKAGGPVLRDLFSEEETGVFVADVALLERLVAKKLEKTAKAVGEEGWKWVEIQGTFDHHRWAQCQRRYPEALPLSLEEAAEVNALNAEADRLEAQGDLDDMQQGRFDAITQRIEALYDRPTVWPPETLSIAGAVVTLATDGKAAIHRGYIKPEDPPTKPRKTAVSEDTSVSESEGENISRLPAALIEDLTAHRSAALNAMLLKRPDIALAVTVHAMASQVFYQQTRGEGVLQIVARTAPLDRAEGSPAFLAVSAAGEHWHTLIPGDPSALLTWCLAQPQEVLLNLLAVCTAQTVNAVVAKNDRPDSRRLTEAGQLAEALKLDMTEWFTPTAENYFSRLSKAGIMAVLREVKGQDAQRHSDDKKAELAVIAERAIAGTGWLPKPLRTTGASKAD